MDRSDFFMLFNARRIFVDKEVDLDSIILGLLKSEKVPHSKKFWCPIDDKLAQAVRDIETSCRNSKHCKAFQESPKVGPTIQKTSTLQESPKVGPTIHETSTKGNNKRITKERNIKASASACNDSKQTTTNITATIKSKKTTVHGTPGSKSSTQKIKGSKSQYTDNRTCKRKEPKAEKQDEDCSTAKYAKHLHTDNGSSSSAERLFEESDKSNQMWNNQSNNIGVSSNFGFRINELDYSSMSNLDVDVLNSAIINGNSCGKPQACLPKKRRHLTQSTGSLKGRDSQLQKPGFFFTPGRFPQENDTYCVMQTQRSDMRSISWGKNEMLSGSSVTTEASDCLVHDTAKRRLLEREQHVSGRYDVYNSGYPNSHGFVNGTALNNDKNKSDDYDNKTRTGRVTCNSDFKCPLPYDMMFRNVKSQKQCVTTDQTYSANSTSRYHKTEKGNAESKLCLSNDQGLETGILKTESDIDITYLTPCSRYVDEVNIKIDNCGFEKTDNDKVCSQNCSTDSTNGSTQTSNQTVTFAGRSSHFKDISHRLISGNVTKSVSLRLMDWQQGNIFF